ncbi:hypothetical protein Tco_1055708 [Tanacetum coccineum]|uniref:Uncharacterized protein n=1 Tax=Tanacetum coccineum TaxID=301880 RepID=A0ABQ5H0F0_9ASTR
MTSWLYGGGGIPFQLKSDSLPHAHAQTTKTYYKHQDSRIKKAQELKTKTFANSDIKDNSLETKLRDRLMQSMSMLVKTQDHKMAKTIKTNKDKDLKISDLRICRKPRFEEDCWPHDNESNMKAWNLSETKLRGRLERENASPEKYDRFGGALVDLRRNFTRGCLLARQACFHDNVKSFDDVGGGVLGPRTLHLDFDILLELLLSDKRSHHDGEKAFFI